MLAVGMVNLLFVALVVIYSTVRRDPLIVRSVVACLILPAYAAACGIPADTLAMNGHWGQVVAMVPSRDAVIVRLGWTFRGGQFDSCAFVASVLKALPR